MRGFRNKHLDIRASDEEMELLGRAARTEGMPLATWLRSVGLRHARDCVTRSAVRESVAVCLAGIDAIGETGN
jgi:uncharacterized protein (DUF1778 family)